MANRIERNLAGRVFNLQKKGSNVPPTVRASARRILQNSNSKNDVENVRKYLGISRSGARSLGRVGRRLARIQGAAFSISQDIELLQTSAQDGRPTAVATARLVNNLNDQVQQAIKSKWARNVTERAAKIIGQDPVVAGRFLKAIGRGARLGGLVATAALGAAEVVEKYFENRRKVGIAEGARRDVARDLALDPVRAREEEAEVMRETLQARGGLRKFLDQIGFRADTQEAATKRYLERIKQLQQARQLAPHMGVNVDEVLAEEAKRRGKVIGELTRREQAEALDKATREKISIERLRESGYVKKRIEREFAGIGSLGHISLAMKDLGSKLGLSQTAEQAISERMDELAREYQAKLLERVENLTEQVDEQARQMRERRTPAEQMKIRDSIERADRQFASHRSRHKAWSTN